MRSKMLRGFNRRFMGVLAMFALALCVAIPASADMATRRVTFVHAVVIGGIRVAAGDYHLVIGGGQVVVKDGKHMVAQAPAKWEQRDDEADHDSVLYADSYHVSEIRFAHQRDVLIVIAP